MYRERGHPPPPPSLTCYPLTKLPTRRAQLRGKHCYQLLIGFVRRVEMELVPRRQADVFREMQRQKATGGQLLLLRPAFSRGSDEFVNSFPLCRTHLAR